MSGMRRVALCGLLWASLAGAQDRAGDPKGKGDAVETNAAVYISRREGPDAKKVVAAAAGAEAKTQGSGAAWTRIELRWTKPSLTLVLNRMPAEDVPQHLNGMSGYAFHCAGRKMDAHTFHLLRRIGRTAHVIGMTAEPAFDARAWAFVAALAESELAVVFRKQAICDPRHRVILGPMNERDANAKTPTFESAEKRRERTLKTIAERGIKTSPALPVIAADEEVRLRTAEEAALRALVLHAMQARAQNIAGFDAAAFLRRHDALKAATPIELAFLKDPAPDKNSIVNMSWRIEALAPLLWSLGLLDSLAFPSGGVAGKDLAIAIGKLTEKGYPAKAKLRPTAEILDQADLSYRLAWTAVEMNLGNIKKGGLEIGAVVERHYAFLWLIRYGDADWDDVDPDT